MTRSDRAIVLTGAAGVIGQALLPELAGRKVVALTYSKPVAGVESVRCDVAEPRLGLDRAAYRALCERADVIVHAAAQTDFTASPASYARTNVTGVENVVRFAADAGRPLYHISTAFVHGLRADAPIVLPEDNLVVGYVRSKVVGDRLIADSGVPHVTFRPSNLIGDSRTGRMLRPQMPQVVCDLICRGKVPIFPAWPDARVDFVPSDLVARAVVAALDAGETGTEYWITAGQDALALEDVVAACVELMARAGQPIEPPVLMRPDEIDLDAPAIRGRMSPFARVVFGQLRDVCDGILACIPFPSSLPQLAARHSVVPGSFREAFLRGLEWSARDAGLMPAQAPS